MCKNYWFDEKHRNYKKYIFVVSSKTKDVNQGGDWKTYIKKTRKNKIIFGNNNNNIKIQSVPKMIYLHGSSSKQDHLMGRFLATIFNEQ